MVGIGTHSGHTVYMKQTASTAESILVYCYRFKNLLQLSHFQS